MVAADTSLGEIEKVYNASLASKGLDPQLLIKIKNFLENLRSALDYLGREIFDRNCTVPQGKHIPVYFPILRETATQADFDAYMKGRFPGLQAAAPHLYSALEGYQAFKSPAYCWLPQLSDLCNGNKHENLTPQTRTEQRETRLNTPSGSLGWNEGIQFGPGGGITFGSGGSIGFGPQGISVNERPVDPRTQLPLTRPGDQLTRVTWVDFRFDAVNVSALPFMNQALAGVKAIMADLSAKI